MNMVQYYGELHTAAWNHRRAVIEALDREEVGINAIIDSGYQPTQETYQRKGQLQLAARQADTAERQAQHNLTSAENALHLLQQGGQSSSGSRRTSRRSRR